MLRRAWEWEVEGLASGPAQQANWSHPLLEPPPPVYKKECNPRPEKRCEEGWCVEHRRGNVAWKHGWPPPSIPSVLYDAPSCPGIGKRDIVPTLEGTEPGDWATQGEAFKPCSPGGRGIPKAANEPCDYLDFLRAQPRLFLTSVYVSGRGFWGPCVAGAGA